MNKFQQQLSNSLKDIARISETICSKDIVSRLDIDVLLEKIRAMYDVAISFSEQNNTKQPEVQEKVVDFIKLELKIEEIKQILDNKPEPVFNKEELKAQIKQELLKDEIPNIIKAKVLDLPRVEHKQEVKVEVKPIEKEPEQELKEEIILESQPDPKVEEKITEEKKEVLEIKPEEPIVEQVLLEQEEKEEIVIEEEQKEEEIIEEDKLEPEIIEEVNSEIKEKEEPKQETPSVLQYLNSNIVKETVNKPTAAQSTLELFAEKNNPSTVADKYAQTKSKFENISESSTKPMDKTDKLVKHTDLRTAIGVNEKFMFINDLFTGDLREYTEFIQKLNDAPTLEEAKTILYETKNKKKWIGNSLSYTTLELVIERRFH